METRESAWRLPGWDECVAYTVPLIRETHSRILSPTSFSPTKQNFTFTILNVFVQYNLFLIFTL